jgi:hypothetical protein
MLFCGGVVTVIKSWAVLLLGLTYGGGISLPMYLFFWREKYFVWFYWDFWKSVLTLRCFRGSCGRVARQRSAKPPTAVRIRS